MLVKGAPVYFTFALYDYFTDTLFCPSERGVTLTDMGKYLTSSTNNHFINIKERLKLCAYLMEYIYIYIYAVCKKDEYC